MRFLKIILILVRFFGVTLSSYSPGMGGGRGGEGDSGLSENDPYPRQIFSGLH